MNEIILEARDLHKRFTQGGGLFARRTTIHAVNGVSLQVRRGETFAIVGESGCGKSTLARLLLRLIEPSEGDVIHEGRSLTQMRAGALRALRSELQFIFQDPFSALKPVNGGAKTGHVAAQNQASGRGVRRHGARADHIAGACHGALACRANPVTCDQVAASVFLARLWPSR